MDIRKKKKAQLKLLVATYNDSAPIYCLLLVWTSNWMPWWKMDSSLIFPHLVLDMAGNLTYIAPRVNNHPTSFYL